MDANGRICLDQKEWKQFEEVREKWKKSNWKDQFWKDYECVFSEFQLWNQVP